MCSACELCQLEMSDSGRESSTNMIPVSHLLFSCANFNKYVEKERLDNNASKINRIISNILTMVTNLNRRKNPL
jgi:hypothetical protein